MKGRDIERGEKKLGELDRSKQRERDREIVREIELETGGIGSHL